MKQKIILMSVFLFMAVLVGSVKAQDSAGAQAAAQAQGVSQPAVEKQDAEAVATADDTGRLHVTLEPYFLSPMAYGHVSVDGSKSNVRSGFDDLIATIDELRMYLGGRFEISKGKLAFLYDGFYYKLKDKKNKDVSGVPLTVDANITFKLAIQEWAGAYQMGEWNTGAQKDKLLTADLIVGARQVYLRADVDVTATLDIPTVGRLIKSGSKSGTQSWVNPFIGGRISYPLSERLVLGFRADLGGFGAESDFTWNSIIETRYYLSKNKNGFMSFGFRGYGDYYNKKGFDYNLIIYGPIVSAGYRF